MIHSLYKQEVYLDKEQHRYFNNDGDEYMSFTKLFSFLSPKPDMERIAGAVANRDGMTKNEVLGKWQKTADDGTELDVALKHFSETGSVRDEHSHLEGIVREVSKKYEDYNRVYNDLVVFSHKYKVAGEIDRLSLLSNRRTSVFHLSDFKRFEGGMKYESVGQRWLNYPFEHHVNSKYVKICFQASFYAYLFEELTEHKCERLFIDLIQPITDKNNIITYHNTTIPIPYLKTDIMHLLEHFDNRIKTTLQPKQEIEDEF